MPLILPGIETELLLAHTASQSLLWSSSFCSFPSCYAINIWTCGTVINKTFCVVAAIGPNIAIWVSNLAALDSDRGPEAGYPVWYFSLPFLRRSRKNPGNRSIQQRPHSLPYYFQFTNCSCIINGGHLEPQVRMIHSRMFLPESEHTQPTLYRKSRKTIAVCSEKHTKLINLLSR